MHKGPSGSINAVSPALLVAGKTKAGIKGAQASQDYDVSGSWKSLLLHIGAGKGGMGEDNTRGKGRAEALC